MTEPAMSMFELFSDQTKLVIPFEAPTVEGYVVGRTDDSSDFVPDIDLARYEAREQGVSRRHVAIVSYRGQMHVIDLNSVNGTFLNGRRLPPDNPQLIEAGDELRLGTFTLHVRSTPQGHG